MTSNRWTEKEMDVLYQLFDMYNLKEIAGIMKRTYHSVCYKSIKMGLRKETGEVRRKHNNGYIVVRCDDYPDDWPGLFNKTNKAKYVYEHYVNWWKSRPTDKIQRYELLHHIDGNMENNDVMNLQKINKREHVTWGRWKKGLMRSNDVEQLEERMMSAIEINRYVEIDQVEIIPFEQ